MDYIIWLTCGSNYRNINKFYSKQKFTCILSFSIKLFYMVNFLCQHKWGKNNNFFLYRKRHVNGRINFSNKFFLIWFKGKKKIKKTLNWETPKPHRDDPLPKYKALTFLPLLDLLASTPIGSWAAQPRLCFN